MRPLAVDRALVHNSLSRGRAGERIAHEELGALHRAIVRTLDPKRVFDAVLRSRGARLRAVQRDTRTSRTPRGERDFAIFDRASAARRGVPVSLPRLLLRGTGLVQERLLLLRRRSRDEHVRARHRCDRRDFARARAKPRIDRSSARPRRQGLARALPAAGSRARSVCSGGSERHSRARSVDR